MFKRAERKKNKLSKTDWIIVLHGLYKELDYQKNRLREYQKELNDFRTKTLKEHGHELYTSSENRKKVYALTRAIDGLTDNVELVQDLIEKVRYWARQ